MAKPKLTYAEQLRHPNWQRKRLQVLERAGWKCEICGDADTTLNVHHKRYVKGRLAWEYELDELSALCEPCHAERHENEQLLLRITHEADSQLVFESAIALIAGYFYACYDIEDGLAEIARQKEPGMFDVGILAWCMSISSIQDNLEILKKIQGTKREFSLGPVVETLINEYEAKVRRAPANDG